MELVPLWTWGGGGLLLQDRVGSGQQAAGQGAWEIKPNAWLVLSEMQLLMGR